jgi:hypothetical protein
VGHAEAWDDVTVVGSIQDRDCLVAYRKIEKTLAVASMPHIPCGWLAVR